MQPPIESGASDVASELDSLYKLFPEYSRDQVKRAYRSAKAVFVDSEGEAMFMHVMQQKLQ